MLTPIYLNVDNLIRLDQVANPTTGEAITNATITFILKNSSGTTVASGTLTHIETGRYEGVIPYDTVLSVKAKYVLEITVIASVGRDFRRIACEATYRRLN
jgi:hypothetical protein